MSIQLLKIVIFFKKYFPKRKHFECFVLFPSASADCQECGSYVQNVFSFVPSSLATFSLLLLIIFQVHPTVCGKKGKMQLFG